MARLRAGACLAGLAAALWAVDGLGFTGYDTTFGLEWGQDLASLRTPQFEGVVHPTPHPLIILVGAALSPLGPVETVAALQVLALAAFAFLGLAAFRLGSVLFSMPVGVLFALFLLSRPFLAGAALQALVDVPFLALVLAAAAVEARRRRAGTPVLALLAVAGLLRPEAWVLGAAYALYLFPALDVRQRLRAGAIAGVAPVTWLGLDLAVTGDPLFSLHGTQDLAERIQRPRGLGNALDLFPQHLDRVLQMPLVWLGLGGTLVALALLYGRSLLPAALLAMGLAVFLGFGVLHVSLIERYVLVPAAMLALFAAVVLAGWPLLPRGRTRMLWMTAAVPLSVWLALSAPGDARELDRVSTVLERRGEAQRALLSLGHGHPGADLLARCEPVVVPGAALLPSLVFLRPRGEHGLIRTRGIPPRGSRLAVASANKEAASLFGIPAGTGAAARLLHFRVAASNRWWDFYARC